MTNKTRWLFCKWYFHRFHSPWPRSCR